MNAEVFRHIDIGSAATLEAAPERQHRYILHRGEEELGKRVHPLSKQGCEIESTLLDLVDNGTLRAGAAVELGAN